MDYKDLKGEDGNNIKSSKKRRKKKKQHPIRERKAVEGLMLQADATPFNYNVILVNTGDKEPKMEFIRTFKADMTQRNISFCEINYNERTFRNDLVGVLSPTKPNLVMPLSGSLEALVKIKGPLRMLADKSQGYQLTLFGYPEWQTYANECIEDFFALSTYIYTPFYVNSFSSQTPIRSMACVRQKAIEGCPRHCRRTRRADYWRARSIRF